MIYFVCGDAGVRESEPYDPQGDRQKAARYDAIQRNLWGNDNLPPRDRPGEVRVLSHVTKPRSLSQVKRPADRGVYAGRFRGLDCRVAPRLAAPTASPRQRGTPDRHDYTHKQNERKTGLRSPANFVHLDGESRYDAPAISTRSHCTAGAFRGNNAADRSRRGRGSWM